MSMDWFREYDGSCSTRNLHFIPFSHLLLNDLPTMDKDRKEITRRILDFTLEIISLLRGEDYIILKMTSEDCFTPIIHDSEGWIQGPISEPHPLIQEQKILEFTHKMIELLTGEVPIRCQDVAVYFSMEEWQYLEGHKNQYMEVMMEDHRPLPSPARSRTGRTGDESPNPPLHQGQDLSTINCTVKEESYVLHDERQEDVPAEMYVWGEEEWKEDIPADSLPDGGSRSSGGHLTQGTYEEPAILPDISSACPSNDPSSGPFKPDPLFDLPQTVKQNSHENGIENQRACTEEKPFSCSLCGKYFTDESNLVAHERGHSGEKPFSCPECGKCFIKKSNLITHKRIHTGEKPYSCSECGKCFIKKSNLITHETVHTGEKPFPCLECGKCFKQKSDLVRHQRIHSGEKPFSCSECGKCYSIKSNLVEHQRVHTGEKPFSCSECGRSFSQKSGLVKHQTVHSGAKPFSCSECGRCFNQKSALVRHLRIHTGDKPYSCPECGKCFPQKSSLVEHLRSHTGEKPFSCSECGKSFTTQSNLVKHQKIHSGEKPF
ncbi:oocyte zinc finger protein XlCOF7.1-like isoform X2 [Bufo gargarizans]|uniref:oocyte zinc finger protein XlCOF7.1-like isoform X2 n=1 Tax=Bufo gargarizans TaxID=30331 RepID=UPI001CF5FACA|nr:oocyte zinc finger protein XlCOF7.1-like isoform X2 [Bufo gargarizans]